MRAAAADNTPLYEYTVMPTHMNHIFKVSELQQWEQAAPFSFTQGCPVMKIPGRPAHVNHTAHAPGNLLYDLHTDPAQENPLTDSAGEARMIDLLRSLMQANEAPEEQYERLGLAEKEAVA